MSQCDVTTQQKLKRANVRLLCQGFNVHKNCNYEVRIIFADLGLTKY